MWYIARFIQTGRPDLCKVFSYRFPRSLQGFFRPNKETYFASSPNIFYVHHNQPNQTNSIRSKQDLIPWPLIFVYDCNPLDHQMSYGLQHFNSKLSPSRIWTHDLEFFVLNCNPPKSKKGPGKILTQDLSFLVLNCNPLDHQMSHGIHFNSKLGPSRVWTHELL